MTTTSKNKHISPTPELLERIIVLHGEGNTLKSICRRSDMPDISTLNDWLDRFVDFNRRLLRARGVFVDSLVDDTLQIADTAIDPQRAANQIKARQWLASKLNAMKYGDKLALEVEHKLDIASVLAAAKGRLQRPNNDLIIDAECQTIENKHDMLSGSFDKESILGGEEKNAYSILD